MNGLYRPRHGRIIGGVCAGLAQRFGMAPWTVRLLALLSCLLPGAVPGAVPGTAPEAPPEAGAAEGAARLLGHLRDLARSRRRPSRDLTAHEQVHWLADLPGDVYVETDAGPGDVLFSVPVIPLSPPAVLEEFDGWLGLRHWYRILRDLAGHDVVLAAGLLAWRPPDAPPVHDHLLGTPVRIALDERTERIDVVLAGRTALRDRELLADTPGFRPADRVSDAVQAGQGFGLTASVGDVLRKWCAAAITGTVDYREDWAAEGGPTPVPRVRLAPALVVRPPGREAAADYCTRLIGLLSGGVPEGLARFVDPARRPQVMHVPERTPQTVPDLLTGLLVRGHRVLVATSGASASAALRAALPADLAALTVADPATAEQAADAVRARAAAPVPETTDLAEKQAQAEQDVAELTEHLRSGSVADLGSGYRGARGELAERLRAEAPGLSWMPVAPDLPPTPPISAVEAAELTALLASETPERKARTAQRDVDPGALPSAPYVRTLIEAEAAAADRVQRSETDLSRRLRAHDVTLLARLDGAASNVGAALRDLGLDGHPGGWNPADLAVRAFADALARRRPLVWTRVVETAARAGWAERALDGMGGHRVRLPPGEVHLRRVASAAQDLRNHLAEGGTLKRGPLRSAAQKQADALLAGVTVDGEPPATAEALELVFTDVMIRMTCQELQYVWEAAGISFPADLPPAERVARFVRAHARLERVHQAVPYVEETKDLLDRAGLAVPLAHPLQWHGYAAALDSALEGLGVNRAAADLDALRDSIGPAGPGAPPELTAARAAIDARDAAAYGRCLGALAEARHERALQLRCEELLDRVRAVHPDLANLLLATDGDESWHDRTRRWDDAWAWARASGRLAETALSPTEQRLRASLGAAEERLRSTGAALASARAWTAVRASLPPAPAPPLDTVPAWIVPLWRVPDVLPPRSDAFDAVIVDGGQDAGAEALFLLWFAPRTILVGPAGPDLPEPEGPPPATPLPASLRDAITPTATLYGLLAPEPERPADRQEPERPAARQEPERPAARQEPDRPAARHARPSEEPRTPERHVPQVPEQRTGPRPDPPSAGRHARPSVPGQRPGEAPERSAPRPPEQAGPPAQGPNAPPEPRRGQGQAEDEWRGVREAPPVPPPRGESPRVRRGRSIATYRRPELIEIVARVAEHEPDLDDDQLVDLVSRLLACPEDEALLVGARLRYAVEVYREQSAG
ncbi:PspC domain-containing protein [Actinomadura violacea]|uniref:PspC domain-containing protein n=1 Tax=Actinomadura violacea TaxID=2819934 RepID=UPI001E58BBD7|nr:PspC domain-containing protein [Actinomadura violacea]